MQRGDGHTRAIARREGAIALAVFVVAFAVYAFTAYPDVAGGDSGELVAAVAGGGVIHPPGYPAYALLGSVFAHLPLGNLAHRLNLMSGCCDALAAAALYLATLKTTRSRGASLAAAGLFAFAPGIWRYATTAEVFALDNLAIAALLLVAVLYAATRARTWVIAFAFALGLGMSNHHTLLFSAAPLAIWILWIGRAELLAPRTMGLALLALAAGLSPYLDLPIAAARHAPVTWGAANTWSGFVAHVTRREYGTFQLAPSGVAGPGATFGETALAFAEDAWGELGVALALSLGGVVLLGRRARRDPRAGIAVVAVFAIALSVGVIAALGNLPVGDDLHRGIVARFWQQPTVWLCFLAGVGISAAERRLGPRVTVVGGALVALGACALRYESMDRSRDTLVRQYGAEFLRAAPAGALLLTKGDLITNTIRYLQLAEHARPDVRVVDQELLALPWMAAEIARRYPEVTLPGAVFGAPPQGFDMKALLDANVARARILVCGGVRPGDLSAARTYGSWPFGFCEEMRPAEVPVDVEAWIAESGAALPRIDFAGVERPPGSWEAVVWSDYWEVRQTRAAHLIAIAGRDESRRRYIALAADLLEEIVTENPGAPPHVYRNLATALGRAGLDTPARRAQAADAWARYLERGPRDDPQRPAIEKELARLRASP